jgi:hypothetical protein
MKKPLIISLIVALALLLAFVIALYCGRQPIYQTEMVESYRSFPVVWSNGRKNVSGPFLRQSRPASSNDWDTGLKIGPTFLFWSLGDHIYMENPLPPNEPRWEFALSSHKKWSEVKRADLRCAFYGMNDPRGTSIFGANWEGHAVRVSEGQIFFARLVTNPSTVYIVQLAKREVSTNNFGAVLARYMIINNPWPTQ